MQHQVLLATWKPPWDRDSTESSWLQQDELARAAALRNPADRDGFLASRVLLRRLLSRLGNRLPSAWRFATNANGQLVLAAGQVEPALRFSLSRCRGLVACAAAWQHALGVDVVASDEPVDHEAIARHHFAASERDGLQRLPEPQRAESFARSWALKEAHLKARGLGLGVDLKSVVFAAGNGLLAPRLLESPFGRAGDWQHALLRPTPRHVLALAVRRGARPDLAVQALELASLRGASLP